MYKKSSIALFQGTKIRKIWFEKEWWFVIEDIVFALTNSTNPKDYLSKMKKRDAQIKKGWGQLVRTLKVETTGGIQKMNCSNTKGTFRIIQSIPSKKAEPFKLWLAQVGHERIKEIEDPELAQKRIRETYKQKGYSDEWIEKRVRGIQIRDELTNEWKNRNVGKEKEYAILTAQISKATFGITPRKYKKIKGLKKENLRDHMDDLEIIFTMLGEASTTKIARNKNAQGFIENKKVAREGGSVAGSARKILEQKSGEKVIKNQNYLKNKNKEKLK